MDVFGAIQRGEFGPPDDEGEDGIDGLVEKLKVAIANGNIDRDGSTYVAMGIEVPQGTTEVKAIVPSALIISFAEAMAEWAKARKEEWDAGLSARVDPDADSGTPGPVRGHAGGIRGAGYGFED